MRWRGFFAGLILLGGLSFAYANWKGSPLHRYVCGSDAPIYENMMWYMYGEKYIDNWPARLCGCKPPPGYAEIKANVGYHWVNGQLEYWPDPWKESSTVEFQLHYGSRRVPTLPGLPTYGSQQFSLPHDIKTK